MKIHKRQISFLPPKSTHRLGLRWKLGLLHWTWLGFQNFCESTRFIFLFYSLGWLLARQEAAYRRLDPTKAALVCSHWIKEPKIVSGFKDKFHFSPKKHPSSRVKVKIGPLALDLAWFPKFLRKYEVHLSFLLSWLAVGPPRGGLQKVGSNKSSSGLFTLDEGTQNFVWFQRACF